MAVHIHGNTESSSSHYTPIQLEEFNLVCSHGEHNIRIPTKQNGDSDTYSIVERTDYYDNVITAEIIEVDDITSRTANVNEPTVLELLP